MRAPLEKLLGDGVRRSSGKEARNYNLLAARLIADLIKNFLGPRGLEKMFVDILGEVTLTKNGATFLRKIDVEHPAAKVVIEASNAVDNEVGDGTTCVVVLIGALIEKAEELLNNGIAPSTIAAGYRKGLDFSLEVLQSIAQTSKNYDREIMLKIARTCLGSTTISYLDAGEYTAANLAVDAVCTIADFAHNRIEVENIKIEEKIGNSSDSQIVKGIVIDKTIDNSAMPRLIENAKILLINEDLENKRTKSDAEIQIGSPKEIQLYLDKGSELIKLKVQNIINSGANVLISRRGIDLLAQYYLSKAGIISIRRVKENDMQWLEKATDAKITRDLDQISNDDLGFAQKVYEKLVGDDKMVFVEGCKNPKSVTLLLRANSKSILDEYHRSILKATKVLQTFIISPSIVAGGGSTEAIIADNIRNRSYSISGREQIVLQKYADALEEIPLTIAKNVGMNYIDTLTKLRSKFDSINNLTLSNTFRWYGIDAIQRKVEDMFCEGIVEPSIVKEQIIKTATEVSNLLMCVDDVLMARPAVYTHTHSDGTSHAHSGGDKKHDHYFDKLGRQQRPTHHYY
jgi:chaperonin GroEL (HSP60 family)